MRKSKTQRLMAGVLNRAIPQGLSMHKRASIIKQWNIVKNPLAQEMRIHTTILDICIIVAVIWRLLQYQIQNATKPKTNNGKSLLAVYQMKFILKEEVFLVRAKAQSRTTKKLLIILKRLVRQGQRILNMRAIKLGFCYSMAMA